MNREEREQAARTIQEFYDFNKTLTPQGDSWLQADITINRYTQEELGKALPTAIAALREPEWVRTADRLPDDNKPVLVTYVGYTDNLPYADAIAVYAHEMADNYAGAWYWQDSDGVDDNPVSVSITHWMPVPPLPEVGE